MTEKVCARCNIFCSLSNFYAHSKMKDGHLNICKQCVKVQVRSYRLENIEIMRADDRKRGQLESRKRAQSEYLRKPEIREKKRIYLREWIADKKSQGLYIPPKVDMRKVYARTLLARAIKKGIVQKQPCSVCGGIKSEGHHGDYSKPLEVQWLCKEHHAVIHRKYA